MSTRLNACDYMVNTCGSGLVCEIACLVHRPARMNNVRRDLLPNLYGFKMSSSYLKETMPIDKNRKWRKFCLSIFICVEHYAGNKP